MSDTNTNTFEVPKERTYFPEDERGEQLDANNKYNGIIDQLKYLSSLTGDDLRQAREKATELGIANPNRNGIKYSGEAKGRFFYYEDENTRIIPGFFNTAFLNHVVVGTKDGKNWIRKSKDVAAFIRDSAEMNGYLQRFTNQTPFSYDSFYNDVEPKNDPIPPFRGGSSSNSASQGDGTTQGSQTAGETTTEDIEKTLRKNPLNNLYFKMLNTLGIKSSPGVLGTYFLVSPEDVIQTISSYKQAAWEVFKQEKYIRSLPVARRQIPLERMGKITNTDRNSVRPHIIEARMAKTDRMLTGMARRGAAGMRVMNAI